MSATSSTLWVSPRDRGAVRIIDQRALPHRLVVETIRDPRAMEIAIRDMHLRGAPLIGVAGAFGMYLAALSAPAGRRALPHLRRWGRILSRARPTAVNLSWAVQRQLENLSSARTPDERRAIAFDTACRIRNEDIAVCRDIGFHGLGILRAIRRGRNSPLHIMTHCNAGWLACVEWGTATSPIYHAHNAGIPVHVWVSETRPRNQGANLTCWELRRQGVPHTLIADNAAGHLIQRGEVDIVLVGTDRTTRAGDVANKVGTYMKALAARAGKIPFYVAAPSSSIDWSIRDGIRDIPIEEREGAEVTTVAGRCNRRACVVTIAPEGTAARNPAFDVTPAELITGLITERGVCKARERDILRLFPERRRNGD